jgi:hypothetical protein
MWRPSRAGFGLAGLALAALAWPCAPARAQGDPAEEGAPAGSIERYLADRGLNELLAAHLLERLKSATETAERTRLADRLGSLYVQLLDRAVTAEQRQRWEDRSQELLKAVPEADSFELRLNLAKARYLRAEDQAERHRLRLATPEERAEAEAVLRSVVSMFQDIGAKLTRRIDTLEKRESQGRDEDQPSIRAELGESRRLRSLAKYYSGWCNYYLAYLSVRPQLAADALKDFGWLLNAGNDREANVERVPTELLKYEHVARSAVGAALCESLRPGHEVTALRWLEALELAGGVPEAVTRQLFARRMTVLAAARRWSDLSFLVGERRKGQEGQPQPLELSEARLLAVLALEALEAPATRPEAKPVIQSLADLSLTDLVSRGEIRHVQDLVGRYGSANLGGEGFIVLYIRGTQAYERARTAHAAAGDAEEPAADAAVANQYREAAGSLENALKAGDAARFAQERDTAGVLLGLSYFYAGDLVQAADYFERAYRTAADSPQRQAGAAPATVASPKEAEDALWLAVVSLDKALAGKPSVKDRLVALSALYLRTYPRSDRAAKLLLRQVSDQIISEDKAVEILLGVEQSSPLYESARRQAASILYNVYRRARGVDKDFAALRFAEVSEELLRLDRARLGSGPGKVESREVMTQIITRSRQVLDAVLGMTAPDLDRADKAFEILDSIAADAGLDMDRVRDELEYRRLQLALARGRTADATRALDRLRGMGGRFTDAADRLMYKRALAALQAADSPEAALEVVRHGLRVIDQFSKDAAVLGDPAVYGLYNAVSDAAARVYRARGDAAMQDISLGLDRKLVALGNPPAVVLRRYAELAEAGGAPDEALEAWRLLVSGLGIGGPEWYEARYHAIRLLGRKDPAKAREALEQHKILNPDMGPEPWGSRLRELDGHLPAAPAPTGGKP